MLLFSTWGMSSNSHFGRIDTTRALILCQKEHINPKMLVCAISHLFSMQDKMSLSRRGTQSASILQGWPGSSI